MILNGLPKVTHLVTGNNEIRTQTLLIVAPGLPTTALAPTRGLGSVTPIPRGPSWCTFPGSFCLSHHV